MLHKLLLSVSISLTISCMVIFSQQATSPLEDSYKTFMAMKEASAFGLDWVSLGPTVNSARADIVQLDASHPGTMYVGFGSGGVWKTVNNGVTWSSIFDDHSSIGIGDFELAPSDPNIIYLGTGEHLKKPRNFTLPGTGMYRSDDAGATWQQIGLEDSWSIAEIEIHPDNPDIVLVAVLGHLWSTNSNRGLYRTINGGKTWEQVLYKDEMTGANDIVISPSDPRVMYASMWEVYPGISGNNSGVYKSDDGGETWARCTNGLPSGPKIGRISVAVSYTNPDKAYAFIDNLNFVGDNAAAELYRTVDGGETWSRTHSEPFRIFNNIGWYFTDVYLNPQDDDEVYCLGIRLAHSRDGGKSFSIVRGQVSRSTPGSAQGLHLDQCELWINPTNPDHLALGNDGGLYVSYDRGSSWMHYNNIPTGEFYDLTIDQSTYTIYGGTQDNATVSGPAKELNTGFPDPWSYIWIDPWDGGDGCVSQVDPDNSDIIYYSAQHGAARRFDRSKDRIVSIKPSLPKEINDTLKNNYITPYFISPHQGQTLYHGGNFIFKSVDRGDSWKVISPNLANSSIKEKRSFASGALAESSISKGLLYAGMDRGALWVTKNDGETWEERSAGLANNYIISICPSQFVASRVYLAMTGINYDDLHGYLYVSEDYGSSWRTIAAGLPDEPVNVIREDPVYENILYAGTHRGVFISLDRGENWSLLGINMPSTAVADLEIYLPTMDLVAATHGRGIYRTNLRPIHAMIKENLPSDRDYLFETGEIKRPWFNTHGGEVNYSTVEKAPITFWLAESKPVKLSLLDKTGREVWSVSMDGKKGFNQYRWDLVISREESDLPYFVRYERFIRAGDYILKASFGDKHFEQEVVVVNVASPFL